MGGGEKREDHGYSTRPSEEWCNTETVRDILLSPVRFLPTFFPFSLTYSLHGAESFLRS